MKPGVTIRSLAEITFRARSLAIFFETSAILPSLIHTSIAACKFCEGSTTVPPSISKSKVGAVLCCGEDELPPDQIPRGARSAAPPATKYFENSRRFSIRTTLRVHSCRRSLARTHPCPREFRARFFIGVSPFLMRSRSTINLCLLRWRLSRLCLQVREQRSPVNRGAAFARRISLRFCGHFLTY